MRIRLLSWIAVSLMLLVMAGGSAHAQETYAPAFCDFGITFPEAPYTTQRCEGADKKRCYNLVSYTHVYSLSTTVNFRVICNPVDASLQDQYSPEVMKATLRAMTKTSVVNAFNTTYSDEGHYRMAGLVGEGKVGRTPTIYIAQLWIGGKSALSVEAELIGEIDEEADDAFSGVLRSIGHKKDLDLDTAGDNDAPAAKPEAPLETDSEPSS